MSARTSTHGIAHSAVRALARGLTLAFAVAAPLLAHSASAGELTLYEGTNFQGRTVTMRGDVNDLRRSGFNDRASSLVVRSGRWQICADANFQGRCGIFEPGEYAALERFGDTISSARDISDGARRDVAAIDQRDSYRAPDQYRDRDDGYRDQGYRNEGDGDRRYGSDEEREQRRREWRERHGRGPRPQIELFSRPDFGGERLVVNDAEVPTLVERNFNDRARSLMISGGQWEVCEHRDFGGQCAVYGPGEYRHLGHLSRQVTSIRLVDAR